jgi:hypothetical protein
MNSKNSGKKPAREDPFQTALQEFQTTFKPPYLDVGSYIPKGKMDKRDLFDGHYTGIDLQEGPGVDVVHDITVRCPTEKYFNNTVFCLDTFEHIDRPWLASKNIEQAMAVGAQIYVSVPFIWRFHGYPNDYWRMTPEGVRVLFEKIEWTQMFCMDFINNIYPIENLNIHPKKQKPPQGTLMIVSIHMLGEKRWE